LSSSTVNEGSLVLLEFGVPDSMMTLELYLVGFAAALQQYE
jgi:hypothetical protein